MKDRERKRREAEADELPPAPEAQGDGEPSTEAAPSGEGTDQTDKVLDDLMQQLGEQREKYLRLAAEYDNYRKRSAKERADAETKGQAELLTKLLEAIDDLSRFAHIDPAATDPATLHKGIELVEQKMLKSLAAAGLEVINPLDQTFDPQLHEAITTEPALSREDDHTVAKVFQPGYRFNGQLLRPARVVVKQWNG